jgi:predicted nuclease with TOPRIM domain
MADVPVSSAGPGTAPPVPDIKHIEQKELLDRLAQMNRERQEEHQKFNRKLQELQTQAKVDLERLRATTAGHTRDLESQVSALSKCVARLQAEIDRLERENLTLRVQAASGSQVPQTSFPEEKKPGIPLVNSVPGHSAPPPTGVGTVASGHPT